MAPKKGNKYALRHGLCYLPEYAVWNSARDRCTNPNAKFYRDYGGRGIRMYPDWIKSFLPFFEHIGPRPSKLFTLDRINNNKGYEPGNVRWALRKTQMNNTRSNIVITIGDKTMTVAQWAESLGIRPGMVYLRLRSGWDPMLAVTKAPLTREEHGVLARAAARSRWDKYKLLKLNPTEAA